MAKTFLKKLVRRCLRQELQKVIKQTDCDLIVDIGCGNGEIWSGLLDKRIIKIFGVDDSARITSLTNGTNVYDHLFMADASQLPFPNNHFDISVISLLLHAVDRTKRGLILKEARRVTRPGGFIFIFDFAFPATQNLIGKLFKCFFECEERLIGEVNPNHYQNYLDFLRDDGLAKFLKSKNYYKKSCFFKNFDVIIIQV
ncbi:MAG: class I SAM-dependent methyltransferase [Patescibacteria group bacterium]